ncbi:MAG: glutathione peroxidase [Polaromonas sp.]|nr:glutathione peroxidase [Polaromonas sp.]
MNTSIFDIFLQGLDGSETSLAAYQGQVMLVVNVASKCGLTPQYIGLQALHDRFASRGLQVMGFPCNDFAGQEPGSEDEIRDFCDANYHVSFPLFAKVRINSEPRHPLYANLIAAQPHAVASTNSLLRDTLTKHQLLPKKDTDVMWNFEKFLVGRDGSVVARFAPDVAPNDAQLILAIERALG